MKLNLQKFRISVPHEMLTENFEMKQEVFVIGSGI